VESRGILGGVEIRAVKFRQSGGFAGLVRGCEVSGDRLAAGDRQALERHVKAVRTAASPVSDARDLVIYELEVETDAGMVRMSFDESGVPKDLSALVDSLVSRAKPMPL
jgi:hypothetical protein